MIYRHTQREVPEVLFLPLLLKCDVWESAWGVCLRRASNVPAVTCLQNRLPEPGQKGHALTIVRDGQSAREQVASGTSSIIGKG